MNKNNLYGLQDFLKLFVAYKKPQDDFEYALALKNNEYKIILHIKIEGSKECLDVIDCKEEWHKWYKLIFLSTDTWKKIDTSEIISYINNDYGILFNFFMTKEEREKIMKDEEWVTLMEEESTLSTKRTYSDIECQEK